MLKKINNEKLKLSHKSEKNKKVNRVIEQTKNLCEFVLVGFMKRVFLLCLLCLVLYLWFMFASICMFYPSVEPWLKEREEFFFA
jgi:hypothetical protein